MQFRTMSAQSFFAASDYANSLDNARDVAAESQSVAGIGVD